MLVLARKKNQSIRINDNIEIFVVDISHEQVKIGIKAPKDVKIYRQEVYNSIKEEMETAKGSIGKIPKLGDIGKIKKSP